jgi:hypothetical protein
MKGARALGQSGHGALRIVEIAEVAGRSRTGLIARWQQDQLCIGQLSTLFFSFALGPLQPMNAEGAFLHDSLGSAFRTGSPSSSLRRGALIWIQQQTQWLRPPGGIPVKVTNAIWTGNSTIPASDAPFISLEDEALLILVGSPHWTDLDAGRFFAMLARAGDETGMDVGILAL